MSENYPQVTGPVPFSSPPNAAETDYGSGAAFGTGLESALLTQGPTAKLAQALKELAVDHHASFFKGEPNLTAAQVSELKARFPEKAHRFDTPMTMARVEAIIPEIEIERTRTKFAGPENSHPVASGTSGLLGGVMDPTMAASFVALGGVFSAIGLTAKAGAGIATRMGSSFMSNMGGMILLEQPLRSVGDYNNEPRTMAEASPEYAIAAALSFAHGLIPIKKVTAETAAAKVHGTPTGPAAAAAAAAVERSKIPEALAKQMGRRESIDPTVRAEARAKKLDVTSDAVKPSPEELAAANAAADAEAGGATVASPTPVETRTNPLIKVDEPPAIDNLRRHFLKNVANATSEELTASIARKHQKVRDHIAEVGKDRTNEKYLNALTDEITAANKELSRRDGITINSSPDSPRQADPKLIKLVADLNQSVKNDPSEVRLPHTVPELHTMPTKIGKAVRDARAVIAAEATRIAEKTDWGTAKELSDDLKALRKSLATIGDSGLDAQFKARVSSVADAVEATPPITAKEQWALDSGKVRTELAGRAGGPNTQTPAPRSANSNLVNRLKKAKANRETKLFQQIRDDHSFPISEIPKDNLWSKVNTKNSKASGIAIPDANEALRHAIRVSNLVKTLFGKDLRFFTAEHAPLFDGARGQVDNVSPHIYVKLTAQSNLDLWEIVGHELWHRVSNDVPESYGALVDALMGSNDDVIKSVMQRFVDQQGTMEARKGSNALTPVATVDEVGATAMGQMFRDPVFMERMINEVAKAKDPTLVVRMRDFMRGILDTIKTALRLADKGDEGVNKGLMDAHGVVIDALKKLSKHDEAIAKTYRNKGFLYADKAMAHDKHASKFWRLYPEVDQTTLDHIDAIHQYLDEKVLTDRDPFSEYDQTRLNTKSGEGRPHTAGFVKIPDGLDVNNREAVSKFAKQSFRKVRDDYRATVSKDSDLWGYRVNVNEGKIEYFKAVHSQWNTTAESYPGGAPRKMVDERIHQMSQELAIYGKYDKKGAWVPDQDNIKAVNQSLHDIFYAAKEGGHVDRTTRDPLINSFLGSENFKDLMGSIREGRESSFTELADLWNQHVKQELGIDPGIHSADNVLLGGKGDATASGKPSAEVIDTAWDKFTKTLNGDPAGYRKGTVNAGTIRATLESSQKASSWRQPSPFEPHPVIDRVLADPAALAPYLHEKDPNLARMQVAYDTAMEEVQAELTSKLSEELDLLRDQVTEGLKDASLSIKEKAAFLEKALLELESTNRTEHIIDGIPKTRAEAMVDELYMGVNETDAAYSRFLNLTRYAKAEKWIKRRLEARYDPKGTGRTQNEAFVLDAIHEPGSVKSTGNDLVDHAIEHARDLQEMDDSPFGIETSNRIDADTAQKMSLQNLEQDHAEFSEYATNDKTVVARHVGNLLADHGLDDPILLLKNPPLDGAEPTIISPGKEQLHEDISLVAASLKHKMNSAKALLRSGRDLSDPRAKAGMTLRDAQLIDDINFIKRNSPPLEVKARLLEKMEADTYQEMRVKILDHEANQYVSKSSLGQLKSDLLGEITGNGVLGFGKKQITPQRNVSASVNAAREQAILPLKQTVDRLGLNSSVDPAVANGAWLGHIQDIFNGTATAEVKALLGDVADTIAKTHGAIRGRLNKAGANIGEIKDYLFTPGYQVAKITKVGSGFANDLMARLDFAKVEKAVGFNTVDKFTGQPKFDPEVYVASYMKFVQEGGLERPEGVTSLNTSKKDSFHRSFFYKTGEDTVFMENTYGGGDAYGTMLNQMGKRSERAVIMENYGPNYMKNVTDVVGHNDSVFTKDGRFLAYFKQVEGEVNNPADPKIAYVGQITRAYVHAAVGWMGGISQIGDFPNMMAELRRTGADTGTHNFAKFMGDIISDTKRFTPEVRAFFEANGSIADSSAAAMRLLNGGEHLTKDAGKIMGMVNTGNAAQRITAATQLAWTFEMSKHLGQMAGEGKLDLANPKHAQFKRWLTLNNISEGQWQAMSAFADTVEGVGKADQKILLPSMVQDGALRRSFQAMMTDSLGYASGSPGARESTLLTFGTKSGTALGETVRAFAMYKRFLASTLMRSRRRWSMYDLHPELEGSATFHKAIWTGQCLATAYASMAIGDALQGREPLTFMQEDQRSYENFHRLVSRSGAFAGTNAMSLLGLDSSGKPGLSVLGPAIGTVARFSGHIASEDPGSLTQAGRDILGVTPFSNAPIIGQAEKGVVGFIFPELARSFQASLLHQEVKTGQESIYAP